MLLSLFSKKSHFVLAAFLFLAALELFARPNTLPEAVVTAHTIYLENETGFPELQYAAILDLNKWGHFDYAENRAKADLVLRLDGGHLRVHAVPEGRYPGSSAEACSGSRRATRASLCLIPRPAPRCGPTWTRRKVPK